MYKEVDWYSYSSLRCQVYLVFHLYSQETFRNRSRRNFVTVRGTLTNTTHLSSLHASPTHLIPYLSLFSPIKPPIMGNSKIDNKAAARIRRASQNNPNVSPPQSPSPLSSSPSISPFSPSFPTRHRYNQHNPQRICTSPQISAYGY